MKTLIKQSLVEKGRTSKLVSQFEVINQRGETFYLWEDENGKEIPLSADTDQDRSEEKLILELGHRAAITVITEYDSGFDGQQLSF